MVDDIEDHKEKMNDSIQLKHGYIAISCMIILFLYYDTIWLLNAALLVLAALFICYDFFNNAQGTKKTKIIKTVTFIFTYILTVSVFSWIFSISSVEYFDASFKEFIFNQEGDLKKIYFTLYIAVCIIILFILNYVADINFNIVKTITTDPLPSVRKRIYNFIAAYIFVSIVFGVIYNVIFFFNEKTFIISGKINPMLHDFLFFSVSTMATLGAPDIAPTGLLTKSLVMLQIFLNVFVLLIFLSYTFSDTKEPDEK